LIFCRRAVSSQDAPASSVFLDTLWSLPLCGAAILLSGGRRRNLLTPATLKYVLIDPAA
jgi:hypothetical protein